MLIKMHHLGTSVLYAGPVACIFTGVPSDCHASKALGIPVLSVSHALCLPRDCAYLF